MQCLCGLFVSEAVRENQLILDLKNDDRFQTLSETGIINVGITTGNNKYFSVDKKMVEV